LVTRLARAWRLTMRWRVVTLVVSIMALSSAVRTGFREGWRETDISGLVVDQQGDPVGDCLIRALFIKYAPQTKPGRMIMATSFKTTLVAEARTDAAGKYVLKKLSGTDYYLEARAKGFVTVFKDKVAGDATRDWVLARGEVLAGRVIDSESGDPVVGATVRGWHRTGKDTTRRAEAYRWSVDLITDRKGRFKFTSAPRELLELLVWHDEYVNFHRKSSLADLKKKPLILRMTRGLVAAGDVINARTGEPIAHAKVTVNGGELGLPLSQNWTGKDGRFRVVGLPRETVEFEVKHKGFETLHKKLNLRDNPPTGDRMVLSLSPVE